MRNKATLKCKVIIYENAFFGPVEINGVRLSETAVAKKYASQIAGVVQIYELDPGTGGADLRETMANKLTFDEAQAFSGFRLMRKQRLKMFERAIFNQLAAIGL
ncbi:hypothetical protein [Massilia sp. 9096]|uniref:hypothetical protein n=1 Tax=Massilia sp. 9096 TaxID=1500894 RepID=UPI0006894D7E|nr:hypothetical protein [Massilia sp. 9096]